MERRDQKLRGYKGMEGRNLKKRKWSTKQGTYDNDEPQEIY
jgi:hypothetical protein